MRLDVVEQIAYAAQTMNLECEVREDYSGRGMFGETTAALVIDCDLTDFAAVVAQTAVDSIDPREVIRDIRKARTDSMGKHAMVIY